jgi:hypothetical protein
VTLTTGLNKHLIDYRENINKILIGTFNERLSGVNYDALLAGDPNAAPEPATWALAGAVLFIGLGMRRRSAASAAGATRHS